MARWRSWIIAIICAVGSHVIGADDQSQRSIARQMFLNAADRFAWQKYWLPDTSSGLYIPGKMVQVLVRFSKSAVGFCAPALGFCQIYSREPRATLGFLAEWAATGKDYDSPRRFSREYSSAKQSENGRASPSGSPAVNATTHTFDPNELARPHGTGQEPPSEAFDHSLSLTWKLLPLTPPRSISRKIVPTDANAFRAQVIQNAKVFKDACSHHGEVTIPYYSLSDPRVFVLVDVGKGCEKGVFEFIRRLSGGWEFNRFIVDQVDVNLLTPRIIGAKMETFEL